MNFYRLRFTLNSKIRGTNNYVKDYHFRGPHFDGFWWEDPKLIYKIKEKIGFNPTIVDIELLPKSNVLDLIMNGGPASLKLLISGKFKSVIEKYRTKGIQYFQFNIIKDKIVYNDYWVAHVYILNQELIDFPNTTFLYEKQREDYSVSHLTEKITLKFNSREEFEVHEEQTMEKGETTKIINLKLTDNITEDFFALKNVEGGIGYFVSETLKNEIENAGCIGIEFQPSMLSFNEWTTRDGLRDQVYGRSW